MSTVEYEQWLAHELGFFYFLQNSRSKWVDRLRKAVVADVAEAQRVKLPFFSRAGWRDPTLLNKVAEAKTGAQCLSALPQLPVFKGDFVQSHTLEFLPCCEQEAEHRLLRCKISRDFINANFLPGNSSKVFLQIANATGGRAKSDAVDFKDVGWQNKPPRFLGPGAVSSFVLNPGRVYGLGVLQFLEPRESKTRGFRV